MEKYYVAAKNLNKIEGASIKFEDIETILAKKAENNKKYTLGIFGMFDKYGGYV